MVNFWKFLTEKQENLEQDDKYLEKKEIKTKELEDIVIDNLVYDLFFGEEYKNHNEIEEYSGNIISKKILKKFLIIYRNIQKKQPRNGFWRY